MPSADFAAAQERLAARRHQREADARARVVAQQAAHSASLSRLPFPFNRLGGSGSGLWGSISGREGTRPAFRVGQVDAELLDEELLELLKGQVGEGLRYFGEHLQDDYSAEILLVLRAILFKLSIWDHDSSYGAALQGLRYMDARDKSLARPPPKSWQKILYGFFTVGGRYGWTKWEDYLITQSEDYTAESSANLQLLQRFTNILNTTHSLAALASFLVFLTNGRYRTILDRILRIRLTPSSGSTSREVSFEYLNRQLVWHAFTEFLLFLLPLVGISRWRRILSRSWRRLKHFFLYTVLGRTPSSDDDASIIKSGELGFLPERTCAICYKDQSQPTAGASETELLAASSGVIGSSATDVTNPYSALPCGCIYCYVCLAQRIDAEQGDGWTCLRCGEIVTACKPWDGDVLEESYSESQTKGSEVRFAPDTSEGTNRKVPQALTEIPPLPVEDEEPTSASIITSTAASTIDASDIPTIRRDSYRGDIEDEQTGQRGLLGHHSFDESAEWAKEGNIDSDEQSEEYDEEEAGEGSDIGL